MKPSSGPVRGLAIGLTGGIACGKSEVARELAGLGAEVADADDLAHEVIRPGSPGYGRVVARFGREILNEQGEVDRRRLGEIVFADAGERMALEAIIHPEVVRRLRDWVGRVTGRGGHAVAVVPLLYEVGLVNMWDAVVCVIAPEDVVLRRLRARGLGDEAARARIGAQMPVAEKAKKATFVIENGGSLRELKERTREIWNDLLRKGAQ
ncbi:MAG: Dephospho-CoA kinase [Verrucomicrobia bacterium ADurb.Bin345]|nr:MAG: Dephospho-CoA kinase [Verrucomicrobia bacterium ADurb.Bin345]